MEKTSFDQASEKEVVAAECVRDAEQSSKSAQTEEIKTFIRAVNALTERMDRQYKLNVKICVYATVAVLIALACLITVAFYIALAYANGWN